MYCFIRFKQEVCENILSQVIVTEQEVIDMLCTLNANKAVGPDN
jgi:hypothetical protein